MMQEVSNNRERVSALVDGQLQGDEFDQAAGWAARSGDGQLTWQAYHVIGDVLRTGKAIGSCSDVEFMERLKLRLQQESVHPQHPENLKLIALVTINTPDGGQKSLKNEAANDAIYRWKRLAGFASVLAVVSVGFLASGLWDEQRGASVLAQAPLSAAPSSVAASAVVLADGPPVMIRSSELDAMLVAHRQFGGTTALQVPTGFLRNATFEGGGR